jgi:hypothetical protein
MTDTELIIERLCQLPADFGIGAKSMMQLVDRSGIRKNPAILTFQNVSTYVGNHQDIIDHWLRWSANKRVESGWYFTRHVNEYVVGFYPKGEILKYFQPERACAEFIIREVEALLDIANVLARSK